jgi:hypothetical protein
MRVALRVQPLKPRHWARFAALAAPRLARRRALGRRHAGTQP